MGEGSIVIYVMWLDVFIYGSCLPLHVDYTLRYPCAIHLLCYTQFRIRRALHFDCRLMPCRINVLTPGGGMQ